MTFDIDFNCFDCIVAGGKPNRICKLNILNLNKQMKLFSQGMHPVVRCGEYGKWERMKESPTFVVSIAIVRDVFFFFMLAHFVNWIIFGFGWDNLGEP